MPRAGPRRVRCKDVRRVDHRLQRFQAVGLGHRLVPADPRDAGKAHRHPRLVPGGPVHPLERDLDHQLGRDRAHGAEAFGGVVADEAVEFAQLLVGKAEIGLADRHQVGARPQAEGEVRIEPRPLPVAALRVHHHRVHDARVALPLEPRAARAAADVSGVAPLDHHPLDHRVGRVGAQRGKVVPRPERQQIRDVDPVAAEIRGLKHRAAVHQRARAQVLAVPDQKVIDPQARRVAFQQRAADRLAIQALLQFVEACDLAVAADQQFAVHRAFPRHLVDEVGERARHILAGAGIKPPHPALADRLHADAVPFPFGHVLGRVQRAQFLKVGGRGQHHRAERGERGAVGARAAGDPGEDLGVRGFQAVPDFLDVVQRGFPHLRQRRPRKAARQADPQVAGGKFQERQPLGRTQPVQHARDGGRQAGLAGGFQQVHGIGQGQVAHGLAVPDERDGFREVADEIIGQREQLLVEPLGHQPAQ